VGNYIYCDGAIFNFNGSKVAVASTTPSTSPFNGALTVVGGVGIGGGANIGGSSTIKDITQSIPATYSGELRIAGTAQTTVQAVGGIEMVVADGYAWKMQQISNSGAQLSWAVRNGSATWTEVARFNPVGVLSILNTTNSTSPTTGALTIPNGGVGIGLALTVGSTLTTGADIQGGNRVFAGGGGSVAFGTELGVSGSGSATKFEAFSSTNAYRFSGLGAGTMTTDASGNVVITSDETLKVINGSFTAGMSAIRGIEPILYSWREESGNETANSYAGFSGQNVLRFIPEAVGKMADGKLTLQDRPLIAALVNALKELDARIASLETKH
jgi:hypothetical protein